MFTRLSTLLQLRRSTAFLLARADDRLLEDIGLTRADLQAMHLGGAASPSSAAGSAGRFIGRILPA